MATSFAMQEIEPKMISDITEGALAVLNLYPEIKYQDNFYRLVLSFIEGAIQGNQINLITDFDSTITAVAPWMNSYTCIDNLSPENPMRDAHKTSCAYHLEPEQIEIALTLTGIHIAQRTLGIKPNEPNSAEFQQNLTLAIENLVPREGISELLQLFTRENNRVVVVSAGIMEIIQAFIQTHCPEGLSPIIIANSLSSFVNIDTVITRFNKPAHFKNAPSIRQLDELEGSSPEVNLATCIQIGDKPEDLRIIQGGIRIGIGVAPEECDILLPPNCSMGPITAMFQYIFNQIAQYQTKG